MENFGLVEFLRSEIVVETREEVLYDAKKPSDEEFLEGYREARRMIGPHEERRTSMADEVIESLMRGV